MKRISRHSILDIFQLREAWKRRLRGLRRVRRLLIAVFLVTVFFLCNPLVHKAFHRSIYEVQPANENSLLPGGAQSGSYKTSEDAIYKPENEIGEDNQDGDESTTENNSDTTGEDDISDTSEM